MSYTVEQETTVRDCETRSATLCSGVSVTTFAGGARFGRMVQLTLGGGDYIQLTGKQLRRLRRILKHAQKRSLADWPGAR